MKIKEVLLVLAVFLIMAGYHNIDLAWNMDSGCMDFNGIIYQDRQGLYTSGLHLMFSAVVLLFLYMISTSL